MFIYLLTWGLNWLTRRVGACLEQQSAVVDGPCQGTDVVKAFVHSHHSGERNESVGRLEADDAAPACRQSHRAARVRAKRHIHFTDSNLRIMNDF